MFFRPLPRFQNDDPNAGGGGSASPSPAPAPTGGEGGSGSLNIEAVSDQIGRELFGKSEPDEGRSGPARGADGKFAGQPGAGAPAPSPAPSPAPIAGPSPSPAPVGAPSPSPAPAPAGHKPADLSKAPESWKPEEAQGWETLPESVRAAVHRREADMFKGIEAYKGDAGIGRELKQITQPYLEHIRASNLTPMQFYSGLAAMYGKLTDARAPIEDRVRFGVELLSRAGIDLTKYDIIGSDPNAARQPLAPDHPEVKRLTDEIQSLKSRLGERDQRELNAVTADLQSKVEAFAKDPANEYFDEVADHIAILIRGSEGKLTLQEAYDQAVYANPTTRAKLNAKFEQAAQEKAKKDLAERAKQVAGATGANVTSGGHSGTPNSAPTGSWDDTMQETLNAIKKR